MDPQRTNLYEFHINALHKAILEELYLMPHISIFLILGFLDLFGTSSEWEHHVWVSFVEVQQLQETQLLVAWMKELAMMPATSKDLIGSGSHTISHVVLYIVFAQCTYYCLSFPCSSFLIQMFFPFLPFFAFSHLLVFVSLSPSLSLSRSLSLSLSLKSVVTLLTSPSAVVFKQTVNRCSLQLPTFSLMRSSELKACSSEHTCNTNAGSEACSLTRPLS